MSAVSGGVDLSVHLITTWDGRTTFGLLARYVQGSNSRQGPIELTCWNHLEKIRCGINRNPQTRISGITE